jgi:hypothetical protein
MRDSRYIISRRDPVVRNLTQFVLRVPTDSAHWNRNDWMWTTHRSQAFRFPEVEAVTWAKAWNAQPEFTRRGILARVEDAVPPGPVKLQLPLPANEAA